MTIGILFLVGIYIVWGILSQAKCLTDDRQKIGNALFAVLTALELTAFGTFLYILTVVKSKLAVGVATGSFFFVIWMLSYVFRRIPRQ